MRAEERREIEEGTLDYLEGGIIDKRINSGMKALGIEYTERHIDTCKYCLERTCRLANPPYRCREVGARILCEDLLGTKLKISKI